MTRFIGREKEYGSLVGLKSKKTASLAVIRGRRRIGKSRLADEFAKTFKKAIILTGIPPEKGVTAQTQRSEFLRQLQEYRLPIYHADDWGNLFCDLAQQVKTGSALIVLDEITWMGSKDPTFLPKLKTSWDRYFKKNDLLVMIITGSNSLWIEKNILSSTGFYGRVSLRICLKELSLCESNAFFKDWPGVISPYERFKILSVTGGIPRYLEELRSDLTAEANIERLCFDSEGLLFQEFEQIFHDLFENRGPFYKQLVQALVDHHFSMSELSKATGRAKGGDLSAALAELSESGFLTRDFSWSFDKKTKSKIGRYRLSDNYLRFYLKYIRPHYNQIESGILKKLPLGWHSIMGLQFENLVVNNGLTLQKILGIHQEEVLFAAPYLQTQSARRQGCQIDYLIQTRFNTIYICEIKFSQTRLTMNVITEIKAKMTALKLPRGFSCRPVLVHVNGVSPKIVDSGFFSNIVDFSDLLCA